MKMRLTLLFVVLMATLGSRSVFTATTKQKHLQKKVIDFAAKKVPFQGPRQTYDEEEEEEYEDEEEEAEEELLEQEVLNAVGDDYNEANDGGDNDDGDDYEVEDEEEDEGRNWSLLFNSTENQFENLYRQFLCKLFEPNDAKY